jgi:integrase
MKMKDRTRRFRLSRQSIEALRASARHRRRRSRYVFPGPESGQADQQQYNAIRPFTALDTRAE